MRASNSAIQCFKSCRRMYELKYLCGIIPAESTAAQSRGLGYHAALEAHLLGRDFEADPKTLAMVEAFDVYIAPQLAMQKIEVEATEEWFNYITPSGHTVFGRVDGKAGGFIVEHKSTSGKIDGSYWSRLQFDEQILTYLTAYRLNWMFYTVCMTPTLRQKKDESDHDFSMRCLDWYSEDTESKIACMPFAVDQDRLEDFQAEQDAVLTEMQQAHLFYRNPNHCMKWGRMCEYSPLCHRRELNALDDCSDIELIGFTRREPYAGAGGKTEETEAGAGSN